MGAGEVAEEPVASDATFGEGEQADAALGGLGGEVVDPGEIGRFVAGGVLELDDGGAEGGHWRKYTDEMCRRTHFGARRKSEVQNAGRRGGGSGEERQMRAKITKTQRPHR